MSYMAELKEYHKLSAKDLSQDTIKALRWTSSVGLISVIAAQFMIWGLIPTNIYTGCALALGLVTGFLALLSRLPNFLWISEKHLDEWGRGLKFRAEAFTYRTVIYILLIACLIGVALTSTDAAGLRLVLTPSLEQLGFSLILLPLIFQFITTSHLAWHVKPLSDEDVKDMYEIEEPRKIGKWSMAFVMIFAFTGIVGGKLLDRQYKSIINETSESCVITLEAKAPLAQVKRLQACNDLKPKN